MKILFSIPTGYHLRELVMPLKSYLESDGAITEVIGITPAADYRHQVFPSYSNKFRFEKNPDDLEGHKRLFERLQHDVVITNTVGHDELDYPILRAALDMGIPTCTFIASWDNVWKIGRLMNDNRPIAIADHIIVWNQMMHDHFLRLFPDHAKDQISIIGAPRLDWFFQDDKIPSKEDVFQRLGIEDSVRPLIHLATTELYPMEYVAREIRRGIDSEAIPDNPQLFASVHPGGDMRKHESLNQYGVVVRYAFGRREDSPIKQFAYNATEEEMRYAVGLFRYADVLINHSSTTALESLIAGTPVINIKYGAPFDWISWKRSMVYRDFQQHYTDLTADGATTIVDRKIKLIPAIREALQNPNIHEEARNKTIQRMITTIDGTASRKILEKVKSLGNQAST